MNGVLAHHTVTVDEAHIRIKKAHVFSTQVMWDIHYVADDTQNEAAFLLQTPWMIIPYPVNFKDENKTFQFTCCNKEFCDKMLQIEEHILHRIQTTHVDFHNRKLLSNVKCFATDKILRVNGNTFDTKFFDKFANRLEDAQCLSQHKRVCSILFIKAAWCSSAYYGLTVVPLQIMVEILPQLTNHSFLSFNDDDDCDAMAEKYRRMVKMRIPIEAVKNRMELDGHDKGTIDTLLSVLVPTLPSTPPASPPRCAPSPMMGFLSQIESKDFKLKKAVAVEDVEKKVVVNRKLSNMVGSSRQVVPTLDDILCAKERLRKK